MSQIFVHFSVSSCGHKPLTDTPYIPVGSSKTMQTIYGLFWQDISHRSYFGLNVVWKLSWKNKYFIHSNNYCVWNWKVQTMVPSSGSMTKETENKLYTLQQCHFQPVWRSNYDSLLFYVTLSSVQYFSTTQHLIKLEKTESKQVCRFHTLTVCLFPVL